jgi:FkbM family methyltransferase
MNDMLGLLKKKARAVALGRWAPHIYSPNSAPAPLYRILKNRSGLTYMDVGANNGDFFQALAEIADFGSAILIEPLPYLAEVLRRRFPQHTVVEAAVGKEEATIDFNDYPDAPYMSSRLCLNPQVKEHYSIANGNRRIIRVRQRTLDGIVEELHIDRVDLLKIDTQGSERDVLAGGRALLDRTDAIWIEVSFVPLYQGSCLFHEVHDALYGAGFRLFEIGPGWRASSGELAQADALFLRR